jgi:tRNA1Val (adenine37-N6)-methyltransferase
MSEVRDCTRDGFLGGGIIADQPQDGFRAGHDTVLVAAAVPAVAGESVLELGSGVGVASLCLAARVAGVKVLGIEIDPELAGLANANAARNGMADRVRFIAADAADFAHGEPFDHVFFNPPFHPESGQVSPKPARDRARRDTEDGVLRWTRTALALTKSHGTVTAIIRADRAEEMLAEASDMNAVVFPLFPRRGEAAKRGIVRLAKGEPPGRRIAAGLVLHEESGRSTQAAEAVLRHGAPLALA